MTDKNTKKILLTGGGTGGPVTPLLAVAESITNYQLRITNDGRELGIGNWESGRTIKYEFLWIGTKKGPERQMVESASAQALSDKKTGIEFRTIVSGKLRRYFDWQNLVDPFRILIGFFQAFFIILKFKPDLVMSAGGFVSVPVVWSAWILRVPILIHQQDVRPGLANKLMAPFAKVITVTFEKSLADYGKKAVWTGNPVRRDLTIKNLEFRIKSDFDFKNNLPVVLVVGGGTGAGFLNEIILNNAEKLGKFCNVILVAGKNKIPDSRFLIPNSQFRIFEFLDTEDMASALNAASVVISRCGMSFLTELSYLGKPSVLIPIPDSHQEDNVEIFKNSESAIVFDQKKLTPDELILSIQKLLSDGGLRDKLSGNIRQVIKTEGAGEEICGIIEGLLGR